MQLFVAEGCAVRFHNALNDAALWRTAHEDVILCFDLAVWISGVLHKDLGAFCPFRLCVAHYGGTSSPIVAILIVTQPDRKSTTVQTRTKKCLNVLTLEQEAAENPNISDRVKTRQNETKVKNGAWNWRLLGLRLDLPHQYVLKMMLLDCRDQ